MSSIDSCMTETNRSVNLRGGFNLLRVQPAKKGGDRFLWGPVPNGPGGVFPGWAEGRISRPSLGKTIAPNKNVMKGRKR